MRVRAWRVMFCRNSSARSISRSRTPHGCRAAWSPPTLLVLAWAYLIYTGTISTIWPLFGTGNQLLATIALAVAPLPGQHGQGKVCVDHGRRPWFRASPPSPPACSRSRHFLAADPKAREGVHRLSGFHSDVESLFWSGVVDFRRSASLDKGLPRSSRSGGSIRPAGDSNGRGKDGLLLEKRSS